MKKILTSVTLLALALFTSKNLYAAENSILSDSIDTSLIASSTLIASEALLIDDDNKSLLASDSIVLDKRENSLKSNAKKDLWIDHQTGKKLKILENNIKELQNIYNVNYRTFRIAEAINDIEKAEYTQKSKNTLMLELSKEQPFTIYSSFYIFPEFLRLNTENYLAFIYDIEKSLTDEIVDKPEEISESINKISKKLDAYRSVNDEFIKLIEKLEKSLNKLKTINYKTNDLTPIGFYIKETNKQIIELLKEQLDSFHELTEQLYLATEYSQEQLNFINTHNQSIAVKCKYLAEIRSSFKDFDKYIDSYESKQSHNFYLFSKIFTDRYEKIEKLIGNEEVREGRIKKYIANYNFKPISQRLLVFNANENLSKCFDLFEIAEVNNQLHEQLLPYINGDTWYSRYEEKQAESEDNKNDKKNKAEGKSKKRVIPKLIDFED